MHHVVARVAAALALFVAAMIIPTRASSHEVGLSRGTYSAEGDHVQAEMVLSRREAMSVISSLDADHDGQVTEDEVVAARPAIKKAITDRVLVFSADVPCAGSLDAVTLAEQDGIVFRATYTCPAPIAHAKIDLALLDDLAHGHRHIARATVGAQVAEKVISRSQRTFELDASSAGHSQAQPQQRDHLSLFLLGVEHILTGYDHLVFLLGLVLVGGRWRSLLWVVTAFTVAHSITLGLAALGVWAPRSSIVEPAIALSIAYVGVENFFVKNAEKRWRITFPFGLIHGFGFAGALREVALPRADVPAALFLFNAGVEVGQLGVLAIVLPLLALLRKRRWFEEVGVRVASVIIVVAGIVWFVARIVSG